MPTKFVGVHIKRSLGRKILSSLTFLSLLINSLFPFGLVSVAYAQEATPTEIPTSIPTIIPDLTPTIDLTLTPTVLPTAEPTIEITPTLTEPIVTPEIIPTITIDPTLIPTPEATPTAVIEVTTPIITPTIVVEPTITNQKNSQLKIAGDFQKISSKKNIDYVEGEVIVKFKKSKIDVKSVVGKVQSFVFEKKFALAKTDEIKNINVQVFKSEKSTLDLVKELKADSNVEYAEPNYIRYPATISSNDTSKGLLWGLDNTGQNVNGTTDKWSC